MISGANTLLVALAAMSYLSRGAINERAKGLGGDVHEIPVLVPGVIQQGSDRVVAYIFF